MKSSHHWILVNSFNFIVLLSVTNGLTTTTRALGRGKTDDNPVYVTNYIPASMHVIFHLTDSMKYDLKPTNQPASNPSTTTTLRPTPAHRPGYFAPERPPRTGSELGNENGNGNENKNGNENESFAEWITSLGFRLDHSNQEQSQSTTLPPDLDLFGAGPSDLLHQINTLDPNPNLEEDEETRIHKFAARYDDNYNLQELLRKKKTPPTRAYVTLLSLFDFLNKEAKDLALNKYNGYSDAILKELIRTSSGSSADQLKFVLSQVVTKRNTRKENILNKIKTLLNDLDKPDSYLNEAIKDISPLQFAP